MIRITMEEDTQDAAKMPRHQRYYALHREEKLAKYHTNPEIIAKRQEREQKKIEKEAEKEVKRLEKERIRIEKLTLAIATKQKSNVVDFDQCVDRLFFAERIRSKGEINGVAN